MFEFGLLKWKKDKFFIMKHLFIEHEEPINKNFYLKLLTITLTMSKNQGCQEKKKLNLGITKTRLLRKKLKISTIKSRLPRKN